MIVETERAKVTATVKARLQRMVMVLLEVHRPRRQL
jgi:hypothetical protein